MTLEKRQAERYDKEFELTFDYAAATELKYQVEEGRNRLKEYEGVSKNISANGLCLTSSHKLAIGQHLHLEIFLSKGVQPIHMDGLVCWCDPSLTGKKKLMFNAGIKLQSVEGKSVDETIHMDEKYHVLWSNVLESVFGTFRKLMQERKN